MAGENCLKRLCLAFSVIYGLLGCVTLVIGILAASFQDTSEKIDTSIGIVFCCVTGSLVILLALLGCFAAYRERQWALRLYTAFLIMHALGIFRGLHALSAVNAEMGGAEAELGQLMRTDGKTQRAIEKLQTVSECCGLQSYEDWGDSIPQSCHCPPDYEDRASKCQRVQQRPRDTLGYWDKAFEEDAEMSEVEVYKQPCGPIITNFLHMAIKSAVGLLVTFAVVLIISTILHLMLHCEVKNKAADTPRIICEDPKPPQYPGATLYKGSAF